MKALLIGLALSGLALLGFVAAPKSPEARVICCGECTPGDDCLKKCTVVGEVPKDLKLICCGQCKKGDDCLKKCTDGKSCCR